LTHLLLLFSCLRRRLNIILETLSFRKFAFMVHELQLSMRERKSGQNPLQTPGRREEALRMTRNQLLQEVVALYKEKELEYSTEDIEFLAGVLQHLKKRGITLTREILDFTIDVIRFRNLVGLSADQSEEELDGVKSQMVEWLEPWAGGEPGLTALWAWWDK
jgi:hypothetical protein